MPELIVRQSRDTGEMQIAQRSLTVYDTTKSVSLVVPQAAEVSRDLPVANKPLDRRVLAVKVAGQDKVNPACCYMTRASIAVKALRDTGNTELVSRFLPVYDTKPSKQPFVTPADDNPPVDEGSQKVSDVTFDLRVSYDSYFKFQTRSEDGFRAVLGDDDTVIPSSTNGYEIEAPRVGERVKRTVVTNTGLSIVLNLNPTIVKNYSLNG